MNLLLSPYVLPVPHFRFCDMGVKDAISGCVIHQAPRRGDMKLAPGQTRGKGVAKSLAVL
jgi:hypothetical protein